MAITTIIFHYGLNYQGDATERVGVVKVFVTHSDQRHAALEAKTVRFKRVIIINIVY